MKQKITILILLWLISTSVFALNWECLEHYDGMCHLERAKVFSGWLVRYETVNNGVSITFIPDSFHRWEGKV